MAPQKFAAGVVVVRRTDAGWRVLLLRVYNYWDCPKGEVEAGEDPQAAAQREVREETGIDDLGFTWGTEFAQTAAYSKNKVARYYVAQTRVVDVELPVNPELGKPEHDEFRWLSFDQARDLVVPRIAAVLEWANSRISRADTPRVGDRQ